RRRMMARQVLACVTDLIFQSKIRATAASLGVAVRMASPAGCLEQADQADLLLVDLSAAGEPLELVRQVAARARGRRVGCFAAHVQADLIEQARRAGADEALSRSQFVARLDTLLSGAESDPRGGRDDERSVELE